MTLHALGRLIKLLIAASLLSTTVFSTADANKPELHGVALRTAQQIEADWTCQAVARQLAPATQSISTQKDAAGGCDGIINGTYGFHTSQEQSPWWQVDLGKVETLSRIVIYNRADGVAERAARLKVLLSDDAAQWHEVYQHDGTTFLGAPDNKPLVVSVDGKPGRFVRIQLPGQDYLHLEEIQVYCHGSETNIALRKPANQSSISRWSTWETAGAPRANEPEMYPVAELIERGLLLAADLRKLGVDVHQSETALRQIDDRLQQLSHEAELNRQRKLFLEAQWTIRKMALANPLLDFDDLLLVKRVPGSFTHMSDQYYGWFSQPGGGLYVLEDFKSDSPRLRCLTSALPPGNILRPDISYDGHSVLFAYCKYYPGLSAEPNKLDKANVPEDAFYHLYEMNLDGSGLRRLTNGKYDDFDGRYLPDDRIVFLSTRRGQGVQCTSGTNITEQPDALPDCYVRCGGGPERPVAVYTLHVMDRDGRRMTRISPFEMFEWTPSVDDHGQILYARWDYVDRHNMPYMSLWSTLPDGTDARAVYGNYTQNPHCIFEARRVPNSRKIVFTASGHHAKTGGSIVLLDPTRGSDGEAPLTRLTPEVVFPESEGWPQTYFANPLPLSENHFLVAWSALPLPPGTPQLGTPRPQWGMAGPPNDLGIYLFDAFGNLNLIYRDPEISSMYPLPIRPRSRPPQIASRLDAEQDKETRVLVADVYRGLESIPRGTIKQLRLVGIPAKTHPTMNFPNIGLTRDDPGKFVIGTVPVEEDGSAYFHVPAGVPFFLQALDENGMAIQTMRSATYLQPGQTTTCIGCHEPRNTAPPVSIPIAATRVASKITTGPDGTWPLDYHRLVQPVLDQRCVDCHQPGADGESIDMTADRSYDTLVGYGKPSLKDHVLQRYQDGRSTAGACAAATNPLWKLLANGHYDVKLNLEQRLRLINWMDTYGQRSGSFDAGQADQLLRLRKQSADILLEH